jgi:hypothetical protein
MIGVKAVQWLWRYGGWVGRAVGIGVGLLALLGLLSLLLSGTGRSWLWSRLQVLTAPTYRTQPSPIVIVQQLRAMNRLETARQTTMHDVAVEVSNGLPVWLAGERLRMRVVAEVTAGVDLQRLRAEQVQVEGRRVVVYLPSPQIFDVIIREGDTRVYHRERGWLVFRPNKEIEQRARQQAWLEARNAARESGLLQQARQNAEKSLRELLRQLGFEQVEFRWQPAPRSEGQAVAP